MRIPETVLERLKKLYSKFLWRGNSDSCSILWSSWDRLCLPFAEGGLNCRSLTEIQNIYDQKIWFRFRSKNNLYTRFIMGKYCKTMSHMMAIPKPSHSHLWKRLLSIREEAEDHILWWWSQGEIQPIWKLSRSGTFDSKSTWEVLRQRGTQNVISKKLWNNVTPKKCSFLLWRAQRNYIPVDEIPRKKRIMVISKCQHCRISETIQHVFVDCKRGLDIFYRLFWDQNKEEYESQPIDRHMVHKHSNYCQYKNHSSTYNHGVYFWGQE